MVAKKQEELDIKYPTKTIQFESIKSDSDDIKQRLQSYNLSALSPQKEEIIKQKKQQLFIQTKDEVISNEFASQNLIPSPQRMVLKEKIKWMLKQELKGQEGSTTEKNSLILEKLMQEIEAEPALVIRRISSQGKNGSRGKRMDRSSEGILDKSLKSGLESSTEQSEDSVEDSLEDESLDIRRNVELKEHLDTRNHLPLEERVNLEKGKLPSFEEIFSRYASFPQAKEDAERILALEKQHNHKKWELEQALQRYNRGKSRIQMGRIEEIK